MHRSQLSRRSFLYGTALAAGSATIAACSSSNDGNKPGAGSQGKSPSAESGGGSGDATSIAPRPATFQQAPSLKSQNLPPVERRLPASPLVIPHSWVQRGNYGGSLRMVAFTTTGVANANSIAELFYGFSPLRWLNDGLDIGTGLADRWSSNPDATEWTIHFREGVRWSDGHPLSVDDILFWWEDMVLPGHDALVPPNELMSSAGHLAKLSKIDQSTLKITYDAPQPLLPDNLASWVKGGLGRNGPTYVFPKHYLKQFHTRYTPSVPKDWDSTGGLWERKANWFANPDCPTLVGYKCKTFNNNQGVTLERNPYYYAVTKEGDQLPYIDTIVIKAEQNTEVIKLAIQQGNVDFNVKPFGAIDLSDVSTLSRTKSSGDYNILLWDSGSGTGSMFFLNYDYIAKDPAYGKLFRDKRFRQAISYAYDRATAQKSLYFGTGEITTGTTGPKGKEFHTDPDGPNLYRRWRDSYKKRDLQKAKSLLAELGLKDTNGDGYVEFPDGSELTIDVPYSADISNTYAAADDQLVSDAKEAGLRMVRRPIPPQAYSGQWTSGQLMSHTNWEVSTGTVLTSAAAAWLLPLEPSRWAPLEGAMVSLTGTGKEKQELGLAPIKRHPPRMAPEEGGPIDRMEKLYNEAKREPDLMKRTKLVWDIFTIHITEGPFFIGSVANYPQPVVVKNGLRNVPNRDQLGQHGLVNDWEYPCPAVYDPETFYWDDPSKHAM